MTTDEMQLLRDFRTDIPDPDEESVRRAYAYATSQPQAARRLRLRARRGFREPSWMRSRRRRTVVLGTALGIAALAAVVVIALGAFSAGPAYAVTKNSDGTITITISQFSALSALNQELAQDGLPLKAVPATPDCPFAQGLYTGPRQSGGFAPTDSITINTSYLTSIGTIDLIAVSESATSGRLIFMAAGVPADAVPSCINSAAFGTP